MNQLAKDTLKRQQEEDKKLEQEWKEEQKQIKELKKKEKIYQDGAMSSSDGVDEDEVVDEKPLAINSK